ncbi:hypothetical protein SEVIR_3G194700v4 [Setaria viridis]|uniref:Peroxidase n=2 Tax=Setaria TaxID=4554 RepID=K3Z7N5_SETIT|nr:peroxidase 1 [Setaria italica]XP_034588247.1 peroxidase 1-like [Setaria viridis]RCV17074.1 hypothetical protein SETIT_3G190300v2 [Setaria italica]TKW26504.1 hypothetical protein SEVIR_3G194700v2 [Setaria viridis]
MWRERQRLRPPPPLLVAAAALVVVSALASAPEAALQVGFYHETCPIAEDVVLAEMRLILMEDATVAPALLRMHYHDCFVQGCDGSIMLRSRKKGNKTERDALPNRSMRGYDAIERIKARLEAVCPLTVSCADIIAMAARDAVYLSHGPWYDVETGRRDGNLTVAEYVENDLPPPDSNIVDVKTFFSVKSLNSKDIAVLFGCHSIGTSHCGPIQKRLYNFTGSMDQDPSLNPDYAAELKKLCPPPRPGVDDDGGEGKTKVPLDPGSNYTFDLSYYRHVLATGGLFQSDGSLLHDPVTRGYVEKVAKAKSPDEYYADFAAAMVKMGRTDVLVGDLGEIRPTCGIFVD